MGIIGGVAVEYLDHPRPLAFAHRGGAAHQPENSWRAFEYAAQLGYAYLETDARSTADGKLIAFHDADLDRVTDRTGQVSKLTWKEVSAARVDGTEEIPLLEDLIGTFPELRFNIDLKDEGTIAPLAGVLKRTGRLGPGLHHVVLRRPTARRAALARPAGLPGGHPGGHRGHAVPRAARQGDGPRAWPGPARSARRCRRQIATRGFIRRAHELGLDVHVWTLNTRAEIERALDLGADGVMTDEVVLLRDILTERGQWHPRASGPPR